MVCLVPVIWSEIKNALRKGWCRRLWGGRGEFVRIWYRALKVCWEQSWLKEPRWGFALGIEGIFTWYQCLWLILWFSLQGCGCGNVLVSCYTLARVTFINCCDNSILTGRGRNQGGRWWCDFMVLHCRVCLVFQNWAAQKDFKKRRTKRCKNRKS